MRTKRVAIIGTTGLPAKYGGFETLTHHLVDRLNNRFEITVYCSTKYFAKKSSRPKYFNGAKLVYLPFNANGYQSIIYDICSVFHALRNSDVLLLLGVSGAIILPFVKLFTKKPILINIDGQEWKRPKWNWFAKKILRFSEKIAVRLADTVITDNRIIREYVEEEYNRHDAWLIEYGSDHVTKQEKTSETLTQYDFLDKPYAFNVCRIEPENNIHIVLEAFSKKPNHVLVVVGLWDHGSYGMYLKQKFTGFSNIYLLNPIYDQHALNVLRSNATLYVHGHSAGGTNPSLVEAMGLGLPVAAFDISYNRETTGHNAVYFRNVDDLMEIIEELSNSKRNEISNNLENLAKKKYTWKRIASLYAMAFEGEDISVVDQLTEKIAHQQEEKIVSVTMEKHKVA